MIPTQNQTLSLPPVVVITDVQSSKIPPVKPIKLGEYSYADNYINCDRSRLVGILAQCHLCRTVRTVILDGIIIPESEKSLVDFAIDYFSMFGMKVEVRNV